MTKICAHTHIFLCGCSEKWITQIKTYYVYIYICIPIHTYICIYIYISLSLPVSFSVVAQRSEKPCSGDGSSGSGCSVWPFNFYWVWSECNLKSASDKYSQNSLGLPIRIMVVLWRTPRPYSSHQGSNIRTWQLRFSWEDLHWTSSF